RAHARAPRRGPARVSEPLPSAERRARRTLGGRSLSRRLPPEVLLSPMIASADVVVIGSGAFGASAAYHLARRGVRVAVLERTALAPQTSPRAAGLSSQVRATPALTQLAQRAVAKLAAFSDETSQPLRFTQSGALKIARTERDAEQLAREVARGTAAGVPIELVSVAEARRRLPILGDRGIVAVTWSPTDCNVEPSELPLGYCRAAGKLRAVLLRQRASAARTTAAPPGSRPEGGGGGGHPGGGRRPPPAAGGDGRGRGAPARGGPAGRGPAGRADPPSAPDHRADRRRRARVPDRPRHRRQRICPARARRPHAGRVRGRPPAARGRDAAPVVRHEGCAARPRGAVA